MSLVHSLKLLKIAVASKKTVSLRELSYYYSFNGTHILFNPLKFTPVNKIY